MPHDDTFLERYLDDVEKLEVAYLLWKRGAPISRDELAGSLRISPSLFADLLKALTASAILESLPDGDVQLGYRTIEPAFAALMQRYDDDRFTVIATLSRMAMKRMRAMAARAFANAFVLRKTDPGGEDG